jgi:hypothetical protein
MNMKHTATMPQPMRRNDSQGRKPTRTITRLEGTWGEGQRGRGAYGNVCRRPPPGGREGRGGCSLCHPCPCAHATRAAAHLEDGKADEEEGGADGVHVVVKLVVAVEAQGGVGEAGG